jgi:SPOR domain
MHRALLAIVLVSATATAFGATSYWVSVGSFQDPAVAERAMTEAAAALHEHFVLQRAETPNGVYQRIATGPFASRDEATSALEHAKSNGYADSWVFAAAAGDVSPAEAGPVTGDDLSALEQVLNDDAGDSDVNADLDAMEGDVIVNQPARSLDLDQPVLPKEIPPGYRLNSLFRDGAATTPAR